MKVFNNEIILLQRFQWPLWHCIRPMHAEPEKDQNDILAAKRDRTQVAIALTPAANFYVMYEGRLLHKTKWKFMNFL